MSEKTLPPTESRQRQAREDGRVGVSQDGVKILRLLLMAEVGFATEPLWRGIFSDLLDVGLRQTARPLDFDFGMLGEALVPVLVALIVLAVLPATVAALATLAQTRFNVAPKALSKGVEKLNPGANLKNLISGQKLLMAVLGPTRSGLLLTVAWLKIRSDVPQVALTFRVSPAQGWELALSMLQALERQCIVVLILLIVTDILLQRYLIWRSLRMDHSEVRRDYKQNEGDPMLKGTRKQIAKEIVMSDAPPSRKPSAVVVNPEHIAVSLFYDPELMDVPMVLEKFTDDEAMALRQRAREEGIAVVRYVGLARQLLACAEAGKPVPEPLFRAVALLLRVIELYEQQAPEILRPEFKPGDSEDRLELAAVDDELGASMLELI